VEYCFSRQPFIPDLHMVAVQVQFTNSAAVEAKNLRLVEAKLQSGMRVKEFPEIGEGKRGAEKSFKMILYRFFAWYHHHKVKIAGHGYQFCGTEMIYDEKICRENDQNLRFETLGSYKVHF